MPPSTKPRALLALSVLAIVAGMLHYPGADAEVTVTGAKVAGR